MFFSNESLCIFEKCEHFSGCGKPCLCFVSDHKLLDLDLKIRETDRCTHWYAEPGPLLLVHDSLAGIQRDRVRDGGERDDVSESCKKGASGCYLKNEGTE